MDFFWKSQSRLIAICFCFCVGSSSGFSQSACLTIDSIVVSNTSLNLRTTLALTEYNLLNPEDLPFFQTSITDTASIKQFSKILLTPYQEGRAVSKHSIDARIMVQLFHQRSLLLTIVMDRHGRYSIREGVYWSVDFMKWLNRNVDSIQLPNP